MAKIDNVFNFIGRFVKNPEIQESTNGQKICRFALAQNVTYKDETRAIYPEFVIFGNGATLIEKYCTKGSRIGVTARYDERMYDDKEGKRRKGIAFIVDNITFLGSNRSDNGNSSEDLKESPVEIESDMDDDVPF